MSTRRKKEARRTVPGNAQCSCGHARDRHGTSTSPGRCGVLDGRGSPCPCGSFERVRKATPGREWYTTPDNGIGAAVEAERKPPRSTRSTTSTAPRPTKSAPPSKRAPNARPPLRDPAEVLRVMRAQVADCKDLGPDYVDALSTTLDRVARFNAAAMVAVQEELAATLDALGAEGFFTRWHGVVDPRED